MVSYLNCLFFANDIQIFCEGNFPPDTLLVHKNINCAPGCFIFNFMKFSYKTPQLLSSLEKPNCSLVITNCVNTLLHALTCIKDSAVLFDLNLHYRYHVDYIFSQTIRLLDFTRRVTVSFTCLQGLMMICYTAVMPQLEYACLLWNVIICTDASSLSASRIMLIY